MLQTGRFVDLAGIRADTASSLPQVNRVRFNTQGNKFGVADNDGNLSLWQMSLTTHNGRPFYVSSALTRRCQHDARSHGMPESRGDLSIGSKFLGVLTRR